MILQIHSGAVAYLPDALEVGPAVSCPGDRRGRGRSRRLRLRGYAVFYRCNDNSSYGILWSSYASCYSGPCNANTGTCTGQLFLPRDETFDVVPLLRPGLPWHDVLNTASDSDYG